MKRWIYGLAGMALTLTGCDGPSASIPQNGEQAASDAASAEASEATGFCGHLTSSSNAGDALMQSAFTLTEGGSDYGGAQLIDALVKHGGYRFIGAEMKDRTCWAYSEAKGMLWNKSFHLRWRCPVKAYRVDPNQPDSAVLEMVDSASCDLNASPGDPFYRDITVEAMKI